MITEMSYPGALLAKRVKRSISDPIVLRSRTRNERWTKNMSYNIDYKPDKKNERRSNHIPKTGDDDLSDIFDIFFGYGNKNPFA